jgi:hypothetical protein
MGNANWAQELVGGSYAEFERRCEANTDALEAGESIPYPDLVVETHADREARKAFWRNCKFEFVPHDGGKKLMMTLRSSE